MGRMRSTRPIFSGLLHFNCVSPGPIIGLNFMYRRIELIDEMSAEAHRNLIEAVRQKYDESEYEIKKEYPRFWKSGIMGFGDMRVWDAWVDMRSPRRSINRNVRFYFTEEGWRRYGRKTIEVCQQVGQRYRVIRIKENSVDVVYKDEVQVAVRPKRKRGDKYSPASS